MNERQKNLLKTIVSNYIKTAEPVSSKSIAESGLFDLSPATIRNEMVELEDQGYIYHPHTSAGRIPSEKGYQFYIENFLGEPKLSKKEQEMLDLTSKKFDEFQPSLVKEMAKSIVEFSDNAVFIAFSDRDFYYTGLSNLFSQPEFTQHQLVYHLTKVVEHLDQVIEKIFQSCDDEVRIMIGRDNPFAKDCSSVMTRYQNEQGNGVIGILGPLRMDYQNNLSLVKYTQKLINNF